MQESQQVIVIGLGQMQWVAYFGQGLRWNGKATALHGLIFYAGEENKGINSLSDFLPLAGFIGLYCSARENIASWNVRDPSNHCI